METAEGYHITHYHRPWFRTSRTFGAIWQTKMHFCFQEESLASKTKTFSYSHPVTGRCESNKQKAKKKKDIKPAAAHPKRKMNRIEKVI